MKIIKTKIKDLLILKTNIYRDKRGFFKEVFRKKILNKKFITGGMKPKIETCINAISHGVKEATILDGRIPHSLILELFTEHGIGTQIYS